MLSHDEAQNAQKSIVDAHEYEETRESRRNAHIQDTINVQTQKHVSIAYSCRRRNVNRRLCTRAFFLHQKNNSRFYPNLLVPVLVTIVGDYPVRVLHVEQ